VRAGHRHRPYRCVRHRSSTGTLIFYPGLGMGLANAISVIARAVLPAIGYVRRIFVEEAVLTDTFAIGTLPVQYPVGSCPAW